MVSHCYYISGRILLQNGSIIIGRRSHGTLQDRVYIVTYCRRERVVVSLSIAGVNVSWSIVGVSVYWSSAVVNVSWSIVGLSVSWPTAVVSVSWPIAGVSL